MNIYIFGHSICRRRTPIYNFDTFTDILFEKYNLNPENLIRADRISAERILYFLKKIKDIDLAIIFYGPIDSVFVPSLDRDFTVNKIDDEMFLKYHEKRLKGSIALSDKQQHSNKIEVMSALRLNEKYFQSRDLTVNRNQGALIQIDQYLTSKNIPAIHCPLGGTMPSWFKFTSGKLDLEIGNLQTYDNKHHWADLPNRVTNENNQYIANKLIEYIDQMVGRVGF